jgi:hypothetical protein
VIRPSATIALALLAGEPCAGQACSPPGSLALCQASYDPAGQNVVLARWIDGEDEYPGGVLAAVDGEDADPPRTFDGGSLRHVLVAGLEPGSHTIGIRGVCGEGGLVSLAAEGRIEVLPASPHSRPIEGGIECSHDEASGSTRLHWIPQDPSTFLAVYLEEPSGRLGLVGFAPGDLSSVTLTTAGPDDVFAVQFFAEGPAGCYGSEIHRCEVEPPGPRYVQGLCNGIGDEDGKPLITTAIFGLSYLFSGGPEPPCIAACDANADSEFDLSDMIFILGYMFLGGAAPPSWEDLDGDAGPDPTCIVAGPEEDCASGHLHCAR